MMKQISTEQTSPLMTAEDIAFEVFGNNRSARTISERDSMHPDYPKAKQFGIGGKTGKKYFKREDIFKYYNIANVA